ncbi:MAG: hypothetical protein RLZZ293_1538 [Pseudomonadota bacterium]|jgi:glycosyltransferase involved in cell wall biosynthesis
MQISLIISTYNRPDALELTLLSIAEQILPKQLTQYDVEIIIADDGSTETTKLLIQKYSADYPFILKHIWHEDDGFRLSKIRNLAVANSNGEYLIFIDGDCIVSKDFILQQFYLAENNFFVGGNRVLLSENFSKKIIYNKSLDIVKISIVSNLVNRIYGNMNKCLPALRLPPSASWRKNNQLNWKRPKGCNMAVWRSDFYAINGFDESFIGWGHEDADFLIRLLHFGVRIKDGRFAAPVYHLWHKQNSRANEEANKNLLISRKQSRIISATIGINQYTT